MVVVVVILVISCLLLEIRAQFCMLVWISSILSCSVVIVAEFWFFKLNYGCSSLISLEKLK